VRAYNDDAVVNGLHFDRHAETRAVEVFTQALGLACTEFHANPLGMGWLPNWNRITAAIPDFLERYREAVDKDNEG
jgi:glucosyl-3-phosphoglycerate synthase